MKKTFTRIMAFTALLSLAPMTQAQQYALHFLDGTTPALANGDTVDYTPDANALRLHTPVSFIIENLTEQDLLTTQEVTLVEGGRVSYDVCGGGSCPWDGNPYTVVPGINEDLFVGIEPNYDGIDNAELLFRIDVGNDPDLANSVTAYLRIKINRGNAIDPIEAPVVKSYPNPTTGTVTIGTNDKQAVYDLSGRPAGLYFLPYEGRYVKVIKY